MPAHANIDLLNRLFQIQHRSLAMYLADCCAWTHQGDAQAEATLSHIVRDQRQMAERIADLIIDRGGRIETGGFPMEYTDLHLLSLDFMVRELARYQREDIRAIEHLVQRLAGDPTAQHLAEEVLGAEKAHLESLEEIVRQPV